MELVLVGFLVSLLASNAGFRPGAGKRAWAQQEFLHKVAVRGDSSTAVAPQATSSAARLCAEGGRNRSLPSFREVAEASLNWDDFKMKWPERPSTEAIRKYTALLEAYMIQTPPAPIKVHKRPDDMKYEPDCSDEEWFDGKRERPAHVVDLVLFGYEMDTLEIRLHELDEVVDEFVVIESIYTHRMVRKKPFFAMHRERFERFDKKIIHGIVDDSVMRTHVDALGDKQGKDDLWWAEHRFRGYAYSTYVEVKGKPDDSVTPTIFIAGDLDEIPSARAVAQFKYCKPKKLPSFGGVAFRHGYRFSFGKSNLPSLMSAGDIESKGCHNWKDGLSQHDVHVCAEPEHNRGRGDSYDKPGMGTSHISHFENDYADLYKNFALAEGGAVPDSPVGLELLKDPTLAREWRSKGIRSCCVADKPKSGDVEGVDNWFVKHNRERFPHLAL